MSLSINNKFKQLTCSSRCVCDIYDDNKSFFLCDNNNNKKKTKNEKVKLKLFLRAYKSIL